MNGAKGHSLFLFQSALGIVKPWHVSEYNFDPMEKTLDLYIDFEKGAKFTCPECGAEDAEPYDTSERKWRHLNFFEPHVLG